MFARFLYELSSHRLRDEFEGEVYGRDRHHLDLALRPGEERLRRDAGQCGPLPNGTYFENDHNYVRETSFPSGIFGHFLNY